MRVVLPLVIIVFVLPLVALAGPATTLGSHEAACGDVRWDPVMGKVCPRPGGFEVLLEDGATLWVHGPDQGAPDSPHDLAAAQPKDHEAPPYVCVAPPLGVHSYGAPAQLGHLEQVVTEPHVQLVYDNGGSHSLETALQIWMGAMDILRDRAEEQGRSMRVKILCEEDGSPRVHRVHLQTTVYSEAVDELRRSGFMNPSADYWVLQLVGAVQRVCGIADLALGDEPTPTHSGASGGYAKFAFTYCASVRVALHELGHNMGAVQVSAPNNSHGAHCDDAGADIMCYAGPSGACPTSRWDCGADDYFHARPAPGNYLFDHWNVGSTLNRYLDQPGACEVVNAAQLDAPPAPFDPDQGVVWGFPIGKDCQGRHYRVETLLPDSYEQLVDHYVGPPADSPVLRICWYGDPEDPRCVEGQRAIHGQVPAWASRAEVTTSPKPDPAWRFFAN